MNITSIPGFKFKTDLAPLQSIVGKMCPDDKLWLYLEADSNGLVVVTFTACMPYGPHQVLLNSDSNPEAGIKADINDYALVIGVELNENRS